MRLKTKRGLCVWLGHDAPRQLKTAWRFAAACPLKAVTCTVLLVGLTLSAGPVTAQTMTTEEGLALARAKACLGCHQVDKKRVGPAFVAIAERRAEQPDAVAYLTQVIRKGGRGQWGAVPMPGQAVNEQDAQKLAQWVISLRK